MTTTTFSWKKLRDELAVSEFLLPEDDLRSQRGIIAASIAIMERMANGERLREVSWDGLASKRRKAVVSLPEAKGPVADMIVAMVATPATPLPSNSKAKGQNGKDHKGGPRGNSAILNPIPKPILPGPASAYADITF